MNNSSEETNQLLPRKTAADQEPDAWFLVVDDDIQIRKILIKTLSTIKGWHVRDCANVKEALAEIVDNPGKYDVLITDLMMPGQNGFDLLDELDRLDADIVRIIITGHATAENAIMGIHRRVFDIIPKPFTLEKLRISAMRAIAERRARQREKAYRAELEQTCDLRTHELKQMVNNLHVAQRMMIEKFAAMVDMREHQTGHHSQHVALMFEIIARYAGIPEDRIKILSYGALLHDIGKIALPDSILLKPGPLTDEEEMKMRRHVEYSTLILRDIPFLKEALPVALHHHERYDGKGYPNGLKGDEIPVGARIFAAIDSYEAMRTDRCYRKALTMEAAKTELERHTGTQFDPAIVKIMLKHLDELEAVIKKSASVRRGTGRTG